MTLTTKQKDSIRRKLRDKFPNGVWLKQPARDVIAELLDRWDVTTGDLGVGTIRSRLNILCESVSPGVFTNDEKRYLLGLALIEIANTEMASVP